MWQMGDVTAPEFTEDDQEQAGGRGHWREIDKLSLRVLAICICQSASRDCELCNSSDMAHPDKH